MVKPIILLLLLHPIYQLYAGNVFGCLRHPEQAIEHEAEQVAKGLAEKALTDLLDKFDNGGKVEELAQDLSKHTGLKADIKESEITVANDSGTFSFHYTPGVTSRQATILALLNHVVQKHEADLATAKKS